MEEPLVGPVPEPREPVVPRRGPVEAHDALLPGAGDEGEVDERGEPVAVGRVGRGGRGGGVAAGGEEECGGEERQGEGRGPGGASPGRRRRRRRGDA